MKRNCWEIRNCGRQPGGAKVREFGPCPVTKATNYNGVNSGRNGGRYCWKIAGTLCGDRIQGTFAQKLANCMACEFFHLVKEEEGRNIQL